MNGDGEGYVKVLFRQEGDDAELIVESMWCIPQGQNQFQVANVPFELYRIAFGDIIEAELEEGIYVYTHTVSFSGHSVLRVLHPAEFDGEAFTEAVNALGVWVESATERLTAIDVPADISLQPILTYLREQEAAGILHYEEACLSERHQAHLGA